MKEMHFSVSIRAPKQTVWDTLWTDETFREWAGIIDPGTYMVGELSEGKEIQFISSENGYGVTSLVEKLIINKYLLLRHQADTQDTGVREREKEWTGGTEAYTLEEDDGVTKLSLKVDIPSNMQEYFMTHYPQALNRIKMLAEKYTNVGSAQQTEDL